MNENHWSKTDLMCFCPAKFSSFFPAMKNVWDTGADFIQPSFCFGFFGMDLRHKACHSERTLHIFAWGSWQQDTIFNYKASLGFAQLSQQSKWLQRCWPKAGPANLELELLRWVSLHWPQGRFRETRVKPLVWLVAEMLCKSAAAYRPGPALRNSEEETSEWSLS